LTIYKSGDSLAAVALVDYLGEREILARKGTPP
jgi:hypothetical protein